MTYLSPVVGDMFDITPDTDMPEYVEVTEVTEVPNGFTVTGMPVDSDDDDMSTYTRTFLNNNN